MAGFVPVFPRLGEEGVTAMIWLNWVVPVLICELVLQWRSPYKPKCLCIRPAFDM